MMVVLIVYSCLGMQLYGSQFDEFDELPRQNFDNFVMSFLTLFQVCHLVLEQKADITCLGRC